MRWGIVPFWAKDAKIGYSTINARAEEVAAKPAFREALRKRRCLVPADAFYEWERSDPKDRHPFAIALTNDEPYAFAGLWESWQPREGEPLETFTILTTDANEVVEPIHNRMPVILDPERLRSLVAAGGARATARRSVASFPSGANDCVAGQQPRWQRQK